jgi:GH25 family lysozyme M1 (1,4-beta-N-acetylmuramidase)
MIRGIDVSSVQGDVDWQAVASQGVRFAYVKCGNGNDGVDGGWLDNVQRARAAGLYVGVYHVGFPLPDDPAHPGRNPVDQARAHYAASGGIGARAGDLPCALDLEWPVPGTPEWTKYGCSAEQVREWALAYLAESSAMHCRPTMVYDGFPIYWDAIGGGSEPRFAQYPLWRVDYRAMPLTPKPWTTWRVWQMKGGGPGCMRLPSGAPVDLDVFDGDEDALRAFANAG